MGIRPAKCYRELERPYTRKSKYRKKGFIKSVPNHKIIRFNMGDPKKEFKYTVELKTKQAVQIMHNALESNRQLINRKLQKELGKDYYFRILIYPHHVLRENKMLTGAGADRMQSGMTKSFGRTIGTAARVKVGQSIFSVSVNKNGLDLAKKSFKTANCKLPCKTNIVVHENN